ncbi:MarR family winged helix-turn-helix transcriptional regulator [Mesorhizobium sp. M2D.F.Ca.ET.223.01.1.1]|uniref:MarR family winged helix-turn-helix transcriptional regulator n=1 Tax=Mesorhizobium sp. M2D.F.Ca.ET.223.01.1.1 TaxID=2563940 RepID=UPI001FE0C2AB|nr:MarR family winged helix-turn-helix transcriptional regulator [Mesorhizobium sp. M2D.F.Ca.ET.223.01.1.1]
MFDLDLAPVASELAGELGIVPAHVTRVVRKFAAIGLVEMRKGPVNGQPVLSLTVRGKAALADLETGTNRDLARLIARLGDEEALELSDMLKRVTRLLEKSGQAGSSAA